jgi:hypothetical protein
MPVFMLLTALGGVFIHYAHISIDNRKVEFKTRYSNVEDSDDELIKEPISDAEFFEDDEPLLKSH